MINALIINAREAMPNGGCVHICAENVQIDEQSGLPLEPGRYIKVSIADHGPGVPSELVQKIFDPYFTTKPSSTGLGLAISYSIIRKHGGLLHLENNSPGRRHLCFLSPRSQRQGGERSRFSLTIAPFTSISSASS